MKLIKWKNQLAAMFMVYSINRGNFQNSYPNNFFQFMKDLYISVFTTLKRKNQFKQVNSIGVRRILVRGGKGTKEVSRKIKKHATHQGVRGAGAPRRLEIF